MDWRKWIKEGHEVNAAREQGRPMRPLFRDSATAEQLARLEAELGLTLPSALRELLQQSDGVDLEMYDQGEWFPFLTLVWPCAEIAARTRATWARKDWPVSPGEGVIPLYFTDPLVDGIFMALYVRRSGVEDPTVYAYYPIEGEWRAISPSLAANVIHYDL